MYSIFYFLVTSSDSWTQTYHENFFNAQGGFMWGLVGAIIIGALCSLAFYFGCCNSKTSAKMATLTNWWIALAISALIGYFFADLFVIGASNIDDSQSVFRTHSFYNANEDYFIEQSHIYADSETMIKDLNDQKIKISSDLDKGGDVRLPFDLSSAFWTIFFFTLTSFIVKRFTYNGKTIPCKNP